MAFKPKSGDADAEAKFKLAKGPDFKSRLDGYYDVLGPNQRTLPDDPDAFDPSDICYPLRRALLIRAHRPNRLPDAAREKVIAEISKVLGMVAREMRSAFQRHSDVLAPEPPLLSLISTLAEGADRMAAKAAPTAGFKLDDSTQAGCHGHRCKTALRPEHLSVGRRRLLVLGRCSAHDRRCRLTLLGAGAALRTPPC